MAHMTQYELLLVRDLDNAIVFLFYFTFISKF